MNLPPWHYEQWNTVASALRTQRFPHALLLVGPSGMGKDVFAQQLVASLICKAPTENFRACGLCENCHLLAKGLYFDYQSITPEENSKVIKIDQVRALNDWNTRSASHAHHKVVFLSPLEGLNTAAANSLLKMLEEPVDNRFFVLVCNDLSLVLPTVISRCQVLRFDACDPEVLLQWLCAKTSLESAKLVMKLSSNIPMVAFSMLESSFLENRLRFLDYLFQILKREANPVEFTERFKELDVFTALNLIQSCLTDLQSLRTLGATLGLVNTDYQHELMMVAIRVRSQSLMDCMDAVNRLKLSFGQKANFNWPLQIESLLIQWSSLVEISHVG